MIYLTKPVLRFNSDGKFRVLMISDFHAGSNCSEKLITGIDKLIESSEPDLVLIAGDQCLSKNTKEEVREYFIRIINPVLKRNLPWAAVFGNHDRETGIDIEEEEAVYESIPGCLNSAGPEDVSGTGNYCINILSAKNDEIAYNIWALDSFAETRDFVRNFNLPADTQFVLPEHFNDGSIQSAPMFDQVMWYYNESLKYEKDSGRKIPAIMYMHVPILEFNLVARNPEECGAIGHKRETLGTSELNCGLFMACLQRGDVRGIFCGHEHLCDFEGTYCGIKLAYDGCVGYDMSAHDDLRGGRVIDLFENGDMQTFTIKLIDLMGRDAMRNPDYFEGGCKYHFRKL